MALRKNTLSITDDGNIKWAFGQYILNYKCPELAASLLGFYSMYKLNHS